MGFKQNHSLYERINESNRIINKYPGRIPIICERSNAAKKDCPDIDKNKYLVPYDLTIGQFMYVIRKRLQIHSEKAIFLLINGVFPSSSTMMSYLYNKHKDEDNFLYITYSFENTFGGGHIVSGDLRVHSL
jgi:GABA(A) receptor-associated protein